MGKRTRKRGKCKSVRVSAQDEVYVGLDVHKATVHAALRVNGVLVGTWVMPAETSTVVQSLEPYCAGVRKVVYEAGPTGYGLVRALVQAGYRAEVVAPGKTPRPAVRGSKSDRLDCRTLAEFAEKNLLTSIAIPTEQEEADRQIIRLRTQLMKKQRRVKQQIKSLLLQYGVPEPQGLSHWTIQSRRALAHLTLPGVVRFALDMLVEELEHLLGLLRSTERRIGQLRGEQRHREREARLRTHPGVGERTAMAFLLEVYRPERFGRAEELTAYVGLAPRVSQSGPTRREGPLLKAGRGALRG